MKAKIKAVYPIGNVNPLDLPVIELEKSIRYYENVLGFQVKSLEENPVEAVLLVRDDIELRLAKNGRNPEEESCYFQVDNLDALHQAYQEKKAIRLTAIKDMDDAHGKYRAFWVQDLDGLCYCIGGA